jgi:DNA-binding SARP family transcriptional activator/DNA-binding beta-propeller fold protein YncE
MLDFRILGPFEVHREGGSLPLGGRQQRALLAALVLRANELVSSERLIDELWPEDPPDTADHLVHVYVSRLRKALGDDGRDVLVTRQPGYELLIPSGGRDLDRFEERLGDAKAARDEGRLDDAAEALRDALGLWRGPALADLVSETFARADAARLNELRISAIEDLVEIELARGDPDLVPQLRALVEEHPLRERLRGFLMVALYREGRQAEALQAYEEARATLADELGIDPSQDLQDLYRRVLNQDPELRIERPILRGAVPSQDEDLLDEGGAEGGRRASPLERRRLRATGIVLFAALIVGTMFVMVVRDGESDVVDPAGEVIHLSTDGADVLDRYALNETPSAIAVDGPTVWIADRGAGTVTRIDTDTGRQDPTSAEAEPYELEASDGQAWVIDPFGGSVNVVTAEGGSERVWGSRGPIDAVLAFDLLWVLDAITGSVIRIDPTTRDPVGDRIQLPDVGFVDERSPGPIRIAATSDAVWVLNALRPSLVRIDPEGVVEPTPIDLYCPFSSAASTEACRPTDLAGNERGLWVSMEHAGVVSVFGPDGERRRSQEDLASPTDIALTRDGAWVVTDGGARLVHLDASARPTGSWLAPQLIADVAADDDGAWVSLRAP